jgi:large subunit ribosomal protein L15
MTTLHSLTKIGIKKSKRRGRGYSGKGGHTVGFGQKGQKSRSGFKKFRSWFRQSNILSIPKRRGIGKRSALRGYFTSSLKKNILNVSELNKFKNGTVVDIQLLRKSGIITGKSKKQFIKILGSGKIDKKLTIKGMLLSKTAREKIEKAGGTVID